MVAIPLHDGLLLGRIELEILVDPYFHFPVLGEPNHLVGDFEQPIVTVFDLVITYE